MPRLSTPSRQAGFLRTTGQPHLPVDATTALRPWRESDADAVKEAFDCSTVQRWHVLRMDTRDEAVAWIRAWARRWDDEVDSSWAIADRDGQAIGQVGLRGLSLFEGTAGLSYWVTPRARGAGVAVRAAHALTQWAFDVLDLHRMGLEHSTANEPSCRVATKLGFAAEGVSRGSGKHADGWHDMHRHARLRTDP